MTKFEMIPNQLVPVGFTVRFTGPGTMVMQVAELMPHREAILAFIEERRAYHHKHAAQANAVLEEDGHEDVAEAAIMLRRVNQNLSELNQLHEVFTSAATLSEFPIDTFTASQMFAALKSTAATPA